MYPGSTNAAPPSPPETHAGYFSQVPVQHSAPHRPAMATPNSSFDMGSGLSPAPMETPTSRFRRGSSIGYISTPGHRELRERNGSVASKLLVIIVPPPSVTQEHGSLGHTLANGPPHRLSQGLIMPLLPTMYGQLTAIAREFNFPSPTGICLYYCYTEQGITMAPRLSDDIWQTVWGLGEPTHVNGERRAPIVGKIEFDIDMSQARWYAAWLASRHRESNDFPTPITAPNLQFRGDNRFTFPPPASEDDVADHQSTQLRSAPVMARHTPRKLSLIDRFDSGQSDAKTYRSAVSPPTVLPLSSHVLSPIRQQEEPKTARNNLNDRVKSWRASAIVTPPTDSEPIPAETVKSPSAASPASQSSFHLEDYAFSISSAGPDDASFVGSYHQDYLPSVHMGYRVCGSVGMSESYCTSPGPSDGTFEYYPMEEDSRLPSPDIAYRMFEEAAPSPAPTATSWGAPSQGSWTFSEQVYSPSIDIAHRMCFSAAPSPAPTATSWGAPSYGGCDSPLSRGSHFSVHLCNRGDFSTLPTPQTATSWGAPSCPLSPMSPERLPSPDVGHRLFEESDEFERRAAVAATWVPTAVDEVDLTVEIEVHPPSPSAVPTLVAAPRGRKRTAPAHAASTSGSPSCGQYPSFVLYAPVYPHFDLYPAPAGDVSKFEGATKPEQLPISIACTAGYPLFSLYEPVYPHFDLYPAPAGGNSIPKAEVHGPQQLSVALAQTAGYPLFSLYLPVYPHFDLYPPFVHVLPATSASSPAPLGHPVTTLPAVKAATSNSPVELWGHSWPYRSVDVRSQEIENPIPSPRHRAATSPEEVETKSTTKPWAHSWPFRKPTPSEPTDAPNFVDEPLPIQNPTAPYRKPTVSETAAPTEARSRSSTQPWGHSWPYRKPTVSKATTSQAKLVIAPKSRSATQPWGHSFPYRKAGATMPVKGSPSSGSPILNHYQYPCLVLYPSVYPHFDLYPPPSGGVGEPSAFKSEPLPVVQQLTYPALVIYPAVYPFNLSEIYSRPASALSSKADTIPRHAEDPLAALAGYPSLCIYRLAYPHNLKSIYPSITAQSAPLGGECRRSEDPLAFSSAYPALNIYRPVYPHNLCNIYPPTVDSVKGSGITIKRSEPCVVELDRYPAMQIYSLLYPYNLYAIYPAPAAVSLQLPKRTQPTALSTRFPARYPHFDLYPPVYPHFSLWPINPPRDVKHQSPALLVATPPTASMIRPRQRTHTELHNTVVAFKQQSPTPVVPPPPPPPATLQPPTQPLKRRSGRLTHAELHAMVMMEQRLSLSTQSSTSDFSTPSSPLSPSPVKRAVAVRFEVDVPRRLYSPIRSSTLPPLRFEEPQSELPPVPSSSLSRSSTLPVRRPRPPPTTEAYPGGRSTVYNPENMRARGLGNNTMSRNNLVERRGSTVARRMTIWENGGPQSARSPNPSSAPSIRQAAKNRDSLVFQRIKAFNSS